MSKKYYVLKPFKYQDKSYVRGDEIDLEALGMHSSKIAIRIKAHLIVEESSLTSTEKAKLLRDKSIAQKPIATTASQPKTEPKVEPKPEIVEEQKAEPQTEEPTLFNNNVGGGKGKNRNKNN